jgi:hypothetical protein
MNSPTCFFSNPRWNCMCYYTKVYFIIIPTIHKKYRKQNKQPKRKLIRQIIYDRDFRLQICTNGLVFRECKHIKNIFEDVYFTKNLFHSFTLKIINCNEFHSDLISLFEKLDKNIEIGNNE